MKSILLLVLTTLALKGSANDTCRHYNPFEPWMLEGVYRIIFLDVGDSTGMSGTATVIVYKGEKYLITARHLFDSKKIFTQRTGDGRITVKYILDNGVKKRIFTSEFKGFFDPRVDIAISKLDDSMSLPVIEAGAISTLINFSIGNYAVFMGYPSFPMGGKKEPVFTEIGEKRLPIIKTGRVCGFNQNGPKNGLLIDAMNVKGFSGAPVFVYNDTVKRYTLTAFVSGFFNQNTSEYVENEFIENERIFSNSGITSCVFVDYVYALIDTMITESIEKAD